MGWSGYLPRREKSNFLSSVDLIWGSVGGAVSFVSVVLGRWLLKL